VVSGDETNTLRNERLDRDKANHWKTDIGVRVIQVWVKGPLINDRKPKTQERERTKKQGGGGQNRRGVWSGGSSFEDTMQKPAKRDRGGERNGNCGESRGNKGGDHP